MYGLNKNCINLSIHKISFFLYNKKIIYTFFYKRKQNDKKKYPFLKSPDFAYSGDLNDRINYINNTETTKRKGNNIGVEQYDLNNNLINTFYSLSEAARSVGVSSNSIIRTSDPKMTRYKTCKGFIWKRI